MKTFTEYIKEGIEQEVFAVYFKDKDLYNVYDNEEDANAAAEQLNKEAKDNKCFVKKEKKSDFVK